MSGIPAGWYDDPDDVRQYRYWDGTAWAHQRAPKAAPPPPTGPMVDTAPVASAPQSSAGPTGAERSKTEVGDVYPQSWHLMRKAVSAVAVITALQVGAAIAALVAAGRVVAAMFTPHPSEIFDRVTSPGFDPETNFADDVFLASIRFDWGFDVLSGDFLLLIGSGVASMVVSTTLVGTLARVATTGGPMGLGSVFVQGVRRSPRVFLVAAAVILLQLVISRIVDPLLGFLPNGVGAIAGLALLIFLWPYLQLLLLVTPAVGPSAVDPFRTTIQTVSGRWGFVALRMLLLNIGTVVAFWVALIGGLFAATASLWVFSGWMAVTTAVLMVWSTCGTVAIYRMADGPIDDELSRR